MQEAVVQGGFTSPPGTRTTPTSRLHPGILMSTIAHNPVHIRDSEFGEFGDRVSFLQHKVAGLMVWIEPVKDERVL